MNRLCSVSIEHVDNKEGYNNCNYLIAESEETGNLPDGYTKENISLFGMSVGEIIYAIENEIVCGNGWKITGINNVVFEG